ncbi:MAG: peptidylprolyl isomerase [Spirochaetales bacterium]|nr:peptidylprolyl isomerase [Spirochaetales bacterium]
MKIEKGKVASIEYTLRDDSNVVLDSSEGRSPLVYLHGYRNLIAGMEKALESRVAGDAFSIRLEPEDGYGAYDDELKQTLPRSAFDGVDSIENGMQFQMQSEDGRRAVVRVVETDTETVTVDGNHPLAGQVLNFSVTVVSVRNASLEELAHGHVHGPGGHHH